MKAKLTVALVTGGAKRIGAAIARDLAANGFAVAIHCHTSRRDADALAAAINADGGKAAVVSADLTDESASSSLVEKAASLLGPVSLLVNSASIFEADSAQVTPRELWDRHFAVHVRAPVLLASALSEQLREGGEGLVVNLIDQRVWKLTPQFFSYTLSKSALWTATRTMAQAYAPRIRVNAIGPGPTLANERQAPEDFARQTDNILLHRAPLLSDFGATIRYLWATRSITGQMIALDGGQHLAWETPDVTGMAE